MFYLWTSVKVTTIFSLFSSKYLECKAKSYTFASAFKNERFTKLTPSEDCSGSDKRKSSLNKIYIKQRSSTRSRHESLSGLECLGEQNQSICFDKKGYSSWTETIRFTPYIIYRAFSKRYFYSGEFDPGSGWTLATGLTHASRGAAWRKLASVDGDRRTGE